MILDVIGWFFLCLPFLFLTAMVWRQEGFWFAIGLWVLTLGLIGSMFLGITLIRG